MAKNNDPYENWGPEMLRSLLREGLEHRNAEDFKTAVRVISKKYKKGERIVMDEVTKYLNQNAIRLGSDFADVLAKVLFQDRTETQ
ncbi:hypothetical protein IKF27_00670 [Candidatus Saccharibacteria bacterium]|nr:hypothetical protein [Candidatus Saccharibacteria bacterium]